MLETGEQKLNPPPAEIQAVYAALISHGPLDATRLGGFAVPGVASHRVQQVLADLVALRLVARGARGDYLAVSPDTAAETLAEEYNVRILDQEAQLNRSRQEVTDLRSRIGALRPTYRGARADRPDGLAVRTISSGAEACSVLDQLLAEARREVTICHPDMLHSAGPGTGINPSISADIATAPMSRYLLLAARGVELRMLSRHSTRFDRLAARLADSAIATGIRIRTAPEPPPPMTIVDGAVAFVTSADYGAVVIREPAAVAVLVSVFGNAWCGARALRRDREETREAVEETRLRILQLLAEGLTDKTVAARLGISERTCREHVAALYNQLKVRSRFQAGVAAHASGLVSDP
jgi:DNA-binding CsgD family transcriptional regulator